MGHTLDLDLANMMPVDPSPGELPLSATTPAASQELPDMFSLLGGCAFAPTSPPRRQQFSSRPTPGLRLPSFELLGIAAPHPDRFGSLSLEEDTKAGAGAFDLTPAHGETTLLDSNVVSAMHALDIAPAMPTKPRLPPGMIQTPYRHDVATLTPPADTEPAWRATILANLSNAPLDSRSSDLNSLISAAARSSGERSVAVETGAHETLDSTEGMYVYREQWIDQV